MRSRCQSRPKSKAITDASGRSERSLAGQKATFWRAAIGQSPPGIKRDRLNEVAMMPTPRLAFITIVATLAYLGLAILGWGGFAAFFSHPALIALAIALFVLSGVALFSGGNLSPGEREDCANRWVIVPFALIGLLDAYLYRPTQTGLGSGPSTAMPFAGLASFSSPLVVCCGSGRSLC